MFKATICRAMLAATTRRAPMVEFGLSHFKNALIVVVIFMLADLAGLRLRAPALVLCWLALTAIQVWADLYEFEPITFSGYLALKNFTGWDPRQVDQMIERRIAPLCHALNQLPHTETLYSCQGHLRPYFYGAFPKFQRARPYVMFRSECRIQMRQLSNFLHTDDLTNHWTLSATFRPYLGPHPDPGGDYVWTLRCQTSFGQIWQKRRNIDHDIATITLFLRQKATPQSNT
tara:strand:+ start:18166 stop:18858 length:693 start_codon:yes stop_codon:yes gene_type:complete